MVINFFAFKQKKAIQFASMVDDLTNKIMEIFPAGDTSDEEVMDETMDAGITIHQYATSKGYVRAFGGNVISEVIRNVLAELEKNGFFDATESTAMVS